MTSRDSRLRLICTLIVLGLGGHFLQLASEDTPWRDHAYWRYFNTPGWHLYLPPWLVAGFAVALAIAVIGLAIRRTRPWMLAVIGCYIVHYLTYPYRIRNHMSHTFFELSMLGSVWVVGALLGATDLRGNGPRARLVDRYAVTGMAAVLCITYAYAGLHKINTNFLAQDEHSSAVQGLTFFWQSGHLGHSPPAIFVAIATYGTVVVEMGFPILAWRIPVLRGPLVIGLMIFHFPQVAVMDVADYPMLASTFYPALFSAGHFRLLRPHLKPNGFTLIGSAIGIAMQIYFMPWWGGLTVFGIMVMALWGWAAGAIIRGHLKSARGAGFRCLPRARARARL